MDKYRAAEINIWEYLVDRYYALQYEVYFFRSFFASSEFIQVMETC